MRGYLFFSTFFFNTVIATFSLLFSITLQQTFLASSSEFSSVYTLIIVFTFRSQPCRRRSLKALIWSNERVNLYPGVGGRADYVTYSSGRHER